MTQTIDALSKQPHAIILINAMAKKLRDVIVLNKDRVSPGDVDVQVFVNR